VAVTAKDATTVKDVMTVRGLNQGVTNVHRENVPNCRKETSKPRTSPRLKVKLLQERIDQIIHI
jgi:hypothetical protein